MVCLLGVACGYETLPALSHLGSQVAPNSGDPLFVTWTLGSESHSFVTHAGSMFDANIFYPRRDAIAWSDNMLAAMPLFAAARTLAGGNPIVAYNVVTWAGYVGVGLATYALATTLLRSRAASLIAALLCAVSPIRSFEVGHTQLTGFLFVPLALLLLVRFLRTRERRYALALGAAVAGTWLVTAYYTVLIVLVIAFFLAVWMIQRRFGLGARFWQGMGIAALSALLLVSWTLPPYIRLQQEHLFTRTAPQQLAPKFSDLWLLPPSWLYRTFLGTKGPLNYGRSGLYPGLVLTILVIVGAFGVIGARRRRRAAEPAEPVDGKAAWSPALPLAAGLLPALALTIGPNARHGLSLPFDLLRHTVPGVASLRELSRFYLYVVLCGALAAGYGFQVVSGHVRRRSVRLVLASAVVAIALSELLVRPPLAPVDLSTQATASNRLLAQLPPGPVYELPEPLGPLYPYVTTDRMVRSLIDEDPRIDGYSGNLPFDTELFEFLASRDTVPALLPYLRRFGVRYVLLDETRVSCVSGYSEAQLVTLSHQLRVLPEVASVRRDVDGLLLVLKPTEVRRSVVPFVTPGPQRPLNCG